MDKENYELLGVSETATDEEIEAAYKRLKEKYDKEKWEDGEVGSNAARMLTKINAAYREILEERREKKRAGENPFETVREAIRKGDISKAQVLLDDFNERSAEWHYLQSVVFYKKNWMNESKKQLEIAMQMDPSNQKYREDYQKLSARSDYRTQTGGAPNTPPDPATDDGQMGGNACVSLCNACACMSCLYNCCYCCR